MNTARTERRRNSAVIWIWLAILLFCVIASLAVLFSRMSGFSAAAFENVIPLMAAEQPVAENAADADPAPNGNAAASAQTSKPIGDSSFVAHDAQTMWQTQTEVDIFKLSYENGEGKISVKNNDGISDKLIAPGTSNQYVFTFENNGDTALDYTMTMEAWVEGTEERLPVQARVWDYTNAYLLGSAGTSEDVLALNAVQENGVLGAGRYAVYTLEWEWPFEQGIDEHDTMLGNLAADSDITLTIRITTTAVYDENPDDPDISNSGLSGPKTGDDMPIGKITMIFGATLCIAFVCLLIGYRRKDEKNGQKET